MERQNMSEELTPSKYVSPHLQHCNLKDRVTAPVRRKWFVDSYLRRDIFDELGIVVKKDNNSVTLRFDDPNADFVEVQYTNTFSISSARCIRAANAYVINPHDDMKVGCVGCNRNDIYLKDIERHLANCKWYQKLVAK